MDHAYLRDEMICCDCGISFVRSEADRRSYTLRSEFWGAVSVTEHYYLACPACGSDQIEEAYAIERLH
jgi:hypothetical protein